ncbi:N-acetylmuramoyl-L-alanine amidase [Nocardiopsis sediminis]|uniref:N-acetylmuramoyl-L-alanine amidase n=1 Tax=Nocardiopsis sediminis TaxID=1778267 RepID=A0ABV8FKB6_9ACTN
MPGAIWRPIPVNYNSGGISPRIVVVHLMAGTLTGTDSWFRQSRARASSHFGTGKGGTLYQWVDTRDRAWAQAGGNPYCISIENEGTTNDRLSDNQLDRCAEILAWAHRVHGIALQRADSATGHGLGHHGMGGSAWGGHTSCPGPRIVAQLDEIVARARSIANESAPSFSGGGDTGAPAFPLPTGWYFGPRSGPTASVSGYHGHRDDLRHWQSRMRERGWPLAADGRYGPRTRGVARAFQAEKRLGVDGLIGSATWRAAWESPIT